jgi:restriction system protein
MTIWTFFALSSVGVFHYSSTMTMGNFEYYFIPVLRELDENGKMHRRAIMDAIAKRENISPSELSLTTPKGTNIFRSRVHWSQTFLAQAGAIKRPERGYFEITDRGRRLLADHPGGFTKHVFHDFPDYSDAWNTKRSERRAGVDTHEPDTEVTSTPLEQIETALEQLDHSVSAEIVQRIQGLSPKFLELVVLELLHAMGYGDSSTDIEHLGGPGDEGVDGVINQDSLGLQRIYVQAKRYKSENTIGRPDIQKFVGALTGLGANGGVFITTSTFTADARDYALKSQLSPRIVLIDGEELGKLMVRYGIGVQEKRTYKVVELDEDYFEED